MRPGRNSNDLKMPAAAVNEGPMRDHYPLQGNAPQPAFKPFAAAARLKNFLAGYFAELNAAAQADRPRVAWCTSVGPVELLRSLGFLVYFPENHGALLGASRRAMDYIPTANAQGFSPEVCSYLTSDIGAFIRGETPLTRAYPDILEVPRPHVLVYSTNQCRDVLDWFGWYARRLQAPLLGVESFRQVEEVTSTHVAAMSRQLQALVPPLEAISGEKFDLDRLREVVALSRRGSELWGQVLKTAAHRPSPLTFFDAAIHMAPAVLARGTDAALDYYEELLEEVQGRIDQGVAAVDGERYRLYWEGMPIWGKLRDLAGFLASRQACVVASTYCNSWVFTALEPGDPFDSLARAATELFIVRSEAAKERYLVDMVQRFGIEGMVFHEAKTCPSNSNSRYGLPRRLAARLGLPTVVIHGDVNDLRLYSEEQTLTSLEALLEQMAMAPAR